MARGRDIKPSFFDSDELAEISRDHRLLFIGLWTLADREGRLEDRPARIKVNVFPYDSDITAQVVDAMLSELSNCRGKFVRRYEAGGKRVLLIENFKKHQHIHPNEKPSELSPPPSARDITGALRELPEQSGKATDSSGNSALPSEPSSLLSLPPFVPETLSARDPVPGTTERVPGAYEWLSAFKPLHSQKYNRMSYGRGEQDAKACGKLSDLLDGLPDSERVEAWNRRAEIIAEFLAKDDKRTVDVAHSFAFFVEAFSALRIPPSVRPKALDLTVRSARPVVPLPSGWREEMKAKDREREMRNHGRTEEQQCAIERKLKEAQNGNG